MGRNTGRTFRTPVGPSSRPVDLATDCQPAGLPARVNASTDREQRLAAPARCAITIAFANASLAVAKAADERSSRLG